MNAYAAVAIVNIGLFALIGVALYLTKSPWCLLGLFFYSDYTGSGRRRRGGIRMSRNLDAKLAQGLGCEVDDQICGRYEKVGGECEWCETPLPHYSTDGNAMLELIEEMWKYDIEINIRSMPYGNTSKQFEASTFGVVSERWLTEAFAKTMPLAVALAAHKALFGEEWEECSG